ncbi:MAG: CRISPR-associated ring nuclease [Xanthomonadales bacterium]|jgi:adenosine deaminase|nr:CRISPR-associated ring nuclease [Xanthomonadales bacterium]
MVADEMKPALLLVTLGASWAVVPEIYAWLAPQHCPLYARHPDLAGLDAQRKRHGLAAPAEIWCVTTGGHLAQESVERLREWHARLPSPPQLRIWVAADTDQLANAEECARLRELLFRAVLRAREQVGVDGQLLLSLAGGRKTMSADLQEAGSWFGAEGLLHVVSAEPMPPALKSPSPESLGIPLDAETARTLHPLCLGRSPRSELIDVPLDATPPVTSARFPLPLPTDDTPCVWGTASVTSLLTVELADRQRQSQQLLGNFVSRIAASETHANWLSLYRLPPARVQALRSSRLGPADAAWLQQLPKAELHRHLGGTLDLTAQQTVAQALIAQASGAELQQARDWVAVLAEGEPWDWDWPKLLRGLSSPERALCSAVLLSERSRAQLRQVLHASTAPRVALKSRSKHGFAAYERPGELSGSALLGHPGAIEAYAAAVVRAASAEGLRYLELRGSPQKYRANDPLGFLREFAAALARAGAQVGRFDARHPGLRIGFLWILDRRQRDRVAGVVRQAVKARDALPDFLLGLDLAGDEGTQAPESLSADFRPAFEACLPITIHAGEGESAEHIWQAAYHLHADRIGHGLTLADRPRLMQRFRDRGIALELCPTSNREVVGYADPAVPESAGLPAYPLDRLRDAGVPLTLCTDNPAISQTTLAGEYLTASRMIPGGLSRWQALALIRQAYSHAFLPAAERAELLAAVDAVVYGCAGA